MGHVFISYAREDAGHIDKLRAILNAAGIPYWLDTADLWPGEDWRAKIQEAIRGDALAFLACFSCRGIALPKGFHNEELTLAVEELRLRRPDDPWLIPVRLDECQIPDRAIGGGRLLADLQRIDLFGNGYAANAERLVMAIRRVLGLDTQSTSAGVPQNVSEQAGKRGQWDRHAPKYVVDLRDATNVQVGDGNVQQNSFAPPPG